MQPRRFAPLWIALGIVGTIMLLILAVLWSGTFPGMGPQPFSYYIPPICALGAALLLGAYTVVYWRRGRVGHSN